MNLLKEPTRTDYEDWVESFRKMKVLEKPTRTSTNYDDWIESEEKIKVLEKPTNTDYEDWVESLKHFLSVSKVDMALTEDEPAKPTDTSSDADKLKHDKWLHSDRICLITMKRYMDPKMLKYFNALCDIENAKEFLEAVGKRIRELVKRRNRRKKNDREKRHIWD